MSTLAATSQSDTSPHLATSDVQFRRILLAVDFSKQTAAVIQAAVSIATKFGSELFFVKAAAPASFANEEDIAAIDTLAMSLAFANTRMDELIKSVPELAGFTQNRIVAYANPIDLIHQVIEDNHIDLVIAGSHGASGAERLALGSVAERILRTVRCPVLIVGPHATISPEPFQSVLLASNLSPEGLRSAQYASALAEHFHSSLTLLNVVGQGNRQPGLSEEHLLARLRELVPADFSAHATATARVKYGEAADIIVSLALQMPATLIVTGARDDKPFADHAPWSTLADVIRKAPCPVLSVRGHFG